MISPQDYANKWLGKFREVAGGPLNQCTDGVNGFLLENDLPIVTGRNAYNSDRNNQADFSHAPQYQYVVNTPTLLPKAGWLALFGIGEYGHVAVVMPGTTINDLVVLEQNFPIGAPYRIRTVKNYAAVKGFLVVNLPSQLSNSEVADQVIAQKWGNGADRINRLRAAGYDPNVIQALVNTKLR